MLFIHHSSFIVHHFFSTSPRLREKGWNMRKTHCFALAALVGTIGIGLGVTGTARSQLPARQRPTLSKRVAQAAKVTEEDTLKMLNVLGAEVFQELATGQEVTLPRLGTFRIVR